MTARRSFDVVVVGAGVFGTWIAAYLQRAGKRVAVVEATGPAHPGASSGGESRVTRCGYGNEDLYTAWADRSLAEWRRLSDRTGLPLFHETGVLWIHGAGDPFVEATADTLARHGIPFERLASQELRSRYPVLRVADGEAALLEPRAGGLMAGRAVRALAEELVADGVTLLAGEVAPIRTADAESGVLPAVRTVEGTALEAEQFVFACGPWLDRVCPDAMAGRLFVTRQEVVFFAAERADTGGIPVWFDLPFYGFPSLEGHGFKVADDTHGPAADVATMDRARVSAETVDQARALVARRFPALAGRPVSETRVCQYANSSNGDFVIDRHPGFENAWLAGGGSGHGFKHGPAVGAHVAGLVLGTAEPIGRFALAGKTTRQEREIQ